MFREDLNVYQLIFNNLFIELNTLEFKAFKSYLFNLEVNYWEHQHCHNKLERKIPVPTTQHNLLLLFSRQEVTELKALLTFQAAYRKKWLNVDDINYKLYLN